MRPQKASATITFPFRSPMDHPFFFYSLSILMIASALGVILARNPIYAVLSLVGTLFTLSGLFILLKAYFVAIVQLTIYAGAILILFLFVVMLLDLAPETLSRVKGRTFRFFGVIFGFLFFWQLMVAFRAILADSPNPMSPLAGTTAAVGKLLFTTYALPFEIASVLILVGIIGAVVLAKKKL